ncbi:hypothetical protein VNI00_015761 [Paramarasmius palmivorus]|uniref:Uncharacterized protein n=1 Tax=Paramarasmius palmivorus TaxID=297713 RepID=A0AAW0BHU3_9AGAR
MKRSLESTSTSSNFLSNQRRKVVCDNSSEPNGNKTVQIRLKRPEDPNSSSTRLGTNNHQNRASMPSASSSMVHPSPQQPLQRQCLEKLVLRHGREITKLHAEYASRLAHYEVDMKKIQADNADTQRELMQENEDLMDELEEMKQRLKELEARTSGDVVPSSGYED